MPKQINTYRVGQSLVRMFGLKGRFQPVLDETIVPVVTVGQTELAQVRLAVGGAIGVASGAGNQRFHYFANPANSGVLVTLKQWWAVSGAPLTDFVVVEKFLTPLAVSVAHIWRDTRLNGAPVVRTAAVTQAAAVLVTPQYHLDNDDNVWEQDWVLRSGSFMKFTQNAQNTTFDIGWTWEEVDETATVEI